MRLRLPLLDISRCKRSCILLYVVYLLGLLWLRGRPRLLLLRGRQGLRWQRGPCGCGQRGRGQTPREIPLSPQRAATNRRRHAREHDLRRACGAHSSFPPPNFTVRNKKNCWRRSGGRWVGGGPRGCRACLRATPLPVSPDFGVERLFSWHLALGPCLGARAKDRGGALGQVRAPHPSRW